MVKKKKEEIEIEEIKAATLPLSPLHSNVVRVIAHSDFLMLDFGFVAPSYREPYPMEDNQIARICLDWESGEYLLDSLKDAISDRKKEHESKRKQKVK